MSKVMKGLRLVGLLAMAFVIAHCGDSNVRVTTGPGVAPAPGTFTGSLSDGGSIRIEVGSIEEIEFDCDSETIQETFTPPKQVDSDGTFDIGFSDGGRQFRVQGTFRDNNTVDGSINDEGNECDVTFDAGRGGVVPTPVRTPTGNVATSTPGGGATFTPGGGETSTPGSGQTGTPGGGPTSTTGGTPGPTGSGGTPGPTATANPNACPVAAKVLGTAGSNKALDSGWTGLAHNATVISDGMLTFLLDCANNVRPCGNCTVSGPIQNLKADAGEINAHRCSNDPSIKCENDTPCGSSKCVFYFGAPLPLSAGGINTCVTNQLTSPVTGTANIETGTFQSTLNLSSRVFNQTSNGDPCPICLNDPTLNDGKTGGTCKGGAKDGAQCDANGKSPVPSFGQTSLDCPPSGLISALTIPLVGSSGTETRTLDASSPPCTGVGAGTKKCFCPASGTEPTRPNACLDDTSTPSTDESLCVPVSSGSNKGQCAANFDTQCTPLETFRGCTSNADCTAPGDTCLPINRPCYLDNGIVGGSVSAVGDPDVPVNGVAHPTFASLFCIPPVAQAAINAAGGLPGLGRIELPLTTTEIPVLP